MPVIIKIGKLRKAISKIFLKNEKVRNFLTKIRVEKGALNLVLEYLLLELVVGTAVPRGVLRCRAGLLNLVRYTSTKFSTAGCAAVPVY